MSDRSWREMSESERVNIGEEMALRAIEENANRLAENRARINSLFRGKMEWSVAELQRFVNRINSTARKAGCLEKLPTRVFASREEFLEEAIPILQEHGVSQEDIDKIFALNDAINRSKQ